MVVEPARCLFRRRQRPDPDRVHLWTIQPPEVWNALRVHGELFVELQHLRFDEDDLHLQDAYDWLREQMAQRIPSYAGHYPWWAYDHFLDLRFYRWYGGCVGERRVRLELAVPREEVLLHAYGSWHFVLNCWYHPHAPEKDRAACDLETDEWEAELAATGLKEDWSLRNAEPYWSRMSSSWERIFDVDELRETNTIQATFERLRLADVLSATEFTQLETKG